MSAITVVEAEQQLVAARSEEAQQKRETAQSEIRRLSAEGAQLQAELEPMVQQIKKAQNDRLKLHAELVNARNQIQSYSAALDPLTFPSAKDESNRLEQLELWKAEQKRLIELHADAVTREAIRPQAIALAHRIDSVRREIQNWTAVAEGRKPGESPVGGLFTVGEDFLGRTDRRFD